ncbi:hypothetical protein [Acidaminobacterium chupaoyuni]
MERLSHMSPYSKPIAQAPLAVVVLGNTQHMKFPENWEQNLSAASENILNETKNAMPHKGIAFSVRS